MVGFKYPESIIKKNTTLLVRPGQLVVSANNGIIADVYNPGMYKLNNESMPRLVLMGQAFRKMKNSVRTDLYFINTTLFMNNGWGTKDPVIRHDKELELVRLTAFGNFSFRITDPIKFINEVFGTRLIGSETSETIAYISNIISQYIALALGESEFSIIDMAIHYGDIAEALKVDVNKRLETIGIQIVDLIVENIGTTDKTSKAIDEYSEMNLVKKDFDTYERFQQIKAKRDAASTPGNAMAVEVGMELGKKLLK